MEAIKAAREREIEEKQRRMEEERQRQEAEKIRQPTSRTEGDKQLAQKRRGGQSAKLSRGEAVLLTTVRAKKSPLEEEIVTMRRIATTKTNWRRKRDIDDEPPGSRAPESCWRKAEPDADKSGSWRPGGTSWRSGDNRVRDGGRRDFGEEPRPPPPRDFEREDRGRPPRISTEKIVAARSLVETLGMTAVVGTLDEPESLEMIAPPGLGKVRTGVLGSRNPEVVGSGWQSDDKRPSPRKGEAAQRTTRKS
ncbi:hypothetical protein HPB51_027305 [Rhipicephalus microplus]|uniref:Uncharacterized protein n=1 Tax=Rhipicephalus microplus TaxID=6941 RepID=A0A9J6D0A0_RHIMP|nr:hypothetical protein HPB51_027305 [Rhipicephalus microplus]